jgi:hypothetical protein
MQRKIVSSLKSAVAVLVCALLLDRLVLYLWAYQVIRLHRSMSDAIAARRHEPISGRYGYVASGLEPLLIMPKDPRWPVRLVTLQTDRLLSKPSTITVDGAGGVHLRFLPPRVAWTTWVFPRTDPGHHSDPVAADPRLHYQYKIDIDTSSTRASVALSRGPYHFAQALTPEESRPLLFP